MPTSSLSLLSQPGYSIQRLFLADSDRLQDLFDRCADFFMMTTGVPAAPTDARDEFTDVPDGKTPEAIYAFGLSDRSDRLAGAIVALRHYPDDRTWWIGLMLLAPEKRRQGLGADFYRTFERWVADRGDDFIALCAIACNTAGRQFWQRMGFEVIEKKLSRPYGTQVHDVYVYRRAIAQELVDDFYPIEL